MEKHLPRRRCVGCMTSYSKDTLIRVVRKPDGVVVDESGKMEGRGAYICKNRECLAKAVRAGRFSKALRVQTGEEIISLLEEVISCEG